MGFTWQHYLEGYHAARSYEERHRNLHKALDEENRLRQVYAQEPESPEICDPYLFVIPVHEHAESYKYAQISPEEGVSLGRQACPPGRSAITSEQEFLRNWDIFTEGMLRFLNWDNVFAAGGAVQACLMPIPEEHDKNNRTRRDYLHNIAYKSSDIDLFIWGLTEEEGKKKLVEIYNAIVEVNPFLVIAFRSAFSVTLVSQWPYRHVQIVLRLYKSPAEVLIGFDVDACAVGFDGKWALTMPRAHNSLVCQCNTIDITRRSPSYEMRLAKYAERGFEVLIPGLERQKIDPQLYERPFEKLVGLARLLQMEKLRTPAERMKYKELQRSKRHRPGRLTIGRQSIRLRSTFLRDAFTLEQAGWVMGPEASDYSTVFLPWGPKWNARRVEEIMYKKDVMLNNPFYRKKRNPSHRHPCFFGTIEDIIKDCCGHCPPVSDEDKDLDTPFVSGPLEWITDDPGRQSIGSFHPISDGDWMSGAYVPEVMTDLCSAICMGDVPKVVRLGAGGSLPPTDFLGRSPLELATFANQPKVAKALLDQGALVSHRLSDGRTALHLAAMYGCTEILEMILEKMAQNKEASASAGPTDPSLPQEPDVMEVDDVDADMKMTPLHYAIVFGNVDTVEKLLHAGASPHKMVLLGSSWGQRAFSPLYLASLHPDKETVRTVSTLLVEKGATCIQLDLTSGGYHMAQSTVLDLMVSEGKANFVEMMLEIDPNAVKTINSLSWSRNECYSLLANACERGNLEIAQLLLKAGAKTNPDDSDLDELKRRMVKMKNVRNPDACMIVYPLEKATAFPEIVKLLLKNGAEPNRVAKTTRRTFGSQEVKQTLVDRCEEIIHSTQKALADSEKARDKFIKQHEQGTETQDSDDDLRKRWERTPKGTYARFYYAFLVNEDEFKPVPQSTLARMKSFRGSLEQHDEAIKRLTEELRNAEETLKALRKYGGKKYLDLHPDDEQALIMAQQSTLQQQAMRTKKERRDEENPLHQFFMMRQSQTRRTRAFGYPPNWNVPVPNAQMDSYLRLFEAVWRGDIAEVERLTSNDADDPLLVTVVHGRGTGYTPFSVAMLRGHDEVALRILEIAEEQHVEPLEKEKGDKEGKISNIRLMQEDEDSGSDEDYEPEFLVEEEGPEDPNEGDQDTSKPPKKVFSYSGVADLIIETIHNVPLRMLVTGDLLELLDHTWSSTRHSFRPISVAIMQNNFPCVHHVLSFIKDKTFTTWQRVHNETIAQRISLFDFVLGEGCTWLSSETNYCPYFGASTRLFHLAVAFGCVEIAQYLLETAAHFCADFVPLVPPVERDPNEPPQEDEYAGLDFHGKKNAAKARMMQGLVEADMKREPTQTCPMQMAVAHGQEGMIEWLMGRGPVEALKKFVDTHPDHPVSKTIARLPSGAEEAVARLLGPESVDSAGMNIFHYAVHFMQHALLPRLVGLVQEYKGKVNEQYSVDDYLEGRVKNVRVYEEGQVVPPLPIPCLHMAIQQNDVYGLNALLQIGAKLTAEDCRGWTCAHVAARHATKKTMKALFDRYSPDGLAEALHKPSRDCNQTPLSIATQGGNLCIIKELLNRGSEGDTKDEAGNTPLHTVVPSMIRETVEAVLHAKDQPAATHVANQENATGLTPLDLAIGGVTSVIHSAKHGGIELGSVEVGEPPRAASLSRRGRKLVASRSGASKPAKGEEILHRDPMGCVTLLKEASQTANRTLATLHGVQKSTDESVSRAQALTFSVFGGVRREATVSTHLSATVLLPPKYKIRDEGEEEEEKEE